MWIIIIIINPTKLFKYKETVLILKADQKLKEIKYGMPYSVIIAFIRNISSDIQKSLKYCPSSIFNTSFSSKNKPNELQI